MNGAGIARGSNASGGNTALGCELPAAGSTRPADTDAMLESLQRDAFHYFMHETNPRNGLVLDKTTSNWPSSIAATGLGLTAYTVAVTRGFLARDKAVARVLATLRFFMGSQQGPEADATGYHGFYYHFLDMQSGRRAWQCELSTVDSTILFAGMLAAAAFFDADTAEEREIRSSADALYRRADWQWAQNGGVTVTHGWKPESGFLPWRWRGYDEALLLYVLGLGSPEHPLPDASYPAWVSTYQWKETYGQEYVYAGPLFIHQMSHIWIDFRGIQDAYMRAKGIDYFENSRRATHAQRLYAIDNPLKFAHYCSDCWGVTASDGPGPDTAQVDGIERVFYDYLARGVPYGPDDGTVAPWGVVASLPFAPEIVLPAIEHMVHDLGLNGNPYGFKATFNPTYPEKSGNPNGWVSPWHYGLNQGPICSMIENYRSDLIWRLMRGCPYIVKGLQRAGFQGGWL